jgi:preprotein translocase subunit SecB
MAPLRRLCWTIAKWRDGETSNDQVSAENVGRVVLKLTVTGDPRTKPYRVHLEIVGEFAGKEDASRDDVSTFCREAGPTLLFPYARQIIDRMTSDGFYGAIRLDPIYLRQMLTEQVWQNEPGEVENSATAGSSPAVTDPPD